MLKLKIGKRYVLENGDITAPLRESTACDAYPFEAEVGKRGTLLSWTEDGNWVIGINTFGMDCVREYKPRKKK